MVDVQDTKNSLWRRDDQLKRWELSETNKESSVVERPPLVNFHKGCVFLAACASCDTDEVERLLEKGADIDTANVDGLTALHQSCIDDNEEMVEFLVRKGASLDAMDNEGWTPLHVAASCSAPSIAEFLIQHGADVAAVNNDGDLAIDLAESDGMSDLLEHHMEEKGIDADAARQEEETIMLEHARDWLNSGNVEDKPHPKTKATALHVAAAKGYLEVIRVLIQAGADLEAQDEDGWTPLHAAAHWGQDDACRVLAEHFCQMDTKNYAGQTAYELADKDIQQLLDNLKKDQVTKRKKQDDDKQLPENVNTKVPPLKRRSSVTRMSVDQKQGVLQRATEEERLNLEALRKVEERDEKKGEEESEEESGSSSDEEETETENDDKTNEKDKEIEYNNKQNSKPKDALVEKNENTLKIEESGDIKPPPPKVTSPIEDKSSKNDKPNQIKLDSEKEKIDRTSAILSPKKQEEPKKKDETKIEEKKPQEKAENNTEEKEKEETEKDSVTAPSVVQNNPKTPLGRTTSLPAKVSFGRQSSYLNPPKPLGTTFDRVPTTTTTTSSTEEGPSSWRHSLRKTGSSSAVPDTTTTTREERLAKSASSTTIGATDKSTDDVPKRRIGSVSGLREQDLETKPKYNDFSSRFESRFGSSLSGKRTDPASTSTLTSTSQSTAGMAGSYTHQFITQGYSQTPPYSSLSRRRLEATQAKSGLAISTDVSGQDSITSPTHTASDTRTSVTDSNRTQRRSYDLPKRDEEKEVERKARAKRARETRRSTQGVTKEDLERAEETLKLANRSSSDIPAKMREEGGDKIRDSSVDDKSDKENKPTEDSKVQLRRSKISDNSQDDSLYNRRSTRDSGIDNGSSYRRLTSSSSSIPSTFASDSNNKDLSSLGNRSSYRSSYTSRRDDDKTPLTSNSTKKDDKEEEKDDSSLRLSSSRSRRKRETRRPTGKISPEDIPNLDEDEKDGGSTKEEKKEEDLSRTGSSRYSSRYSDPTGSGLYDTSRYNNSRTDRPSSYYSSSSNRLSSLGSSSTDKDGIDYKKLYEEAKLENAKLRQDIDKLKRDLEDTRLEMEKAKLKNESKGSSSYDSRIDPREKRALERKISEMEEELKQLEKLKAENAKLKDENRALTRVVSKLSK